MMKHTVLVLAPLVALACLLSACGSSSPTAATPVPIPTPTPTTFSLTGQVTSITGAGISGATVRITDGVNAGRSTTTASGGSYALQGLTVSGFTAAASATNYVATSQGVTLTSNQTVNFQLAPTPLFSRAGTGDTVFDMPTTVSRVHVTGSYTGNSSNFIVRVAGRLLVNELLGRGWSMTVYDGTLLTTGGVTEITNSSGVAWTFTEVR